MGRDHPRHGPASAQRSGLPTGPAKGGLSWPIHFTARGLRASGCGDPVAAQFEGQRRRRSVACAGIEVRIEVRGNAHTVYDRYRGERRHNLVGPEDDMWATFADIAEPHALLVDQRIVGCCSIDEDDRLHAFHVSHEAGDLGSAILAHVVDTMNITAAMPSSVDPAFLSLCLTMGGRAEPVAIMYEYLAEPQTSEFVDVRLACRDDHDAAVAFNQMATGSPSDFLERYLAQRIDRGELYLVVDDDGAITAIGECRIDRRADGYAHLGLVVGIDQRGRGVGHRLMRTLTDTAHGKGLTPLCSTEPTNLAAQRVIHGAGFRSRHRVFCVATAAIP